MREDTAVQLMFVIVGVAVVLTGIVAGLSAVGVFGRPVGGLTMSSGVGLGILATIWGCTLGSILILIAWASGE